jgi:hypothetical protein
MKRSHPCAIRDRSRQFCEFLAKEANPPPIGYATTLLVVRRVQISGTVIANRDSTSDLRAGLGHGGASFLCQDLGAG